MRNLRQRVEHELRSNILPFWLKHAPDEKHGGFHGRIANDLTIQPTAPKGLILNARILWTFARAFRVYREPIYRDTARRALDYIQRHFWDQECGGVYWLVDHLGAPVDTKKRIYGQAFALYALAEYHLATGEPEALAYARQLFQAIEAAASDPQRGGYFETYERDWTLATDQRLSAVDMDEKRSMNTHLHLLEGYATLLRASEDAALRRRLGELLDIFLHRIIDPETHHFLMFFDEEWHARSEHISFGHDIEGSWLLCEAAEAFADKDILVKVRREAVQMAQAVYEQAIDPDGGLLYEADRRGIIDADKHWWPQAEAVVGFFNAYQLSGQERFLDTARGAWSFIERFIIDCANGEWFAKVSRTGVPDTTKFKVDEWKCPYHNSRTCFEIMARIDAQDAATRAVTHAG